MIIITTVGTSLLTNLLKEEVKSSFNYSLSPSISKKIQNNSLRRPNAELASAISEVVLGSKDFPIDGKYKLNLNTSAEIKSICRITDGSSAKVYLLATDTFMSAYAAEQIAEHLNGKKGLGVINKGRIKKLKIDAPKDFEQSGFEELIKVLDLIRQDHRDDEVILNISGGYKALIPFLTIYAQLKSLSIKYIYENSDEVISIGNAPLDFDWEIVEQNYFALEKFGDKGEGKPRLTEFKGRLAQDETTQDELFDELVKKGIITKIEEDEVKLTNLGSLYIKTYDEKFHSGMFHRKSLHSKLIEYMVFESFQSKYPGRTHLGYKPPNTNYDIDVFVETKDQIIAVEVKPAGNIPIKEKGKKLDVDTIEHKLCKGSFKHLVESLGKERAICFRYVCYGPLGVHSSPQRQIASLLERVPKYNVPNEIRFELCYLKTPMNFKSNTNWRIDSNHPISPLLSKVLNKN